MYGGDKVEEGATDEAVRRAAPCATPGPAGASLHAGRALHYRKTPARDPTHTSIPDAGVRDFAAARAQRQPTVQAALPCIPGGRCTSRCCRCRNLRTDYPRRHGGVLHAVDGVSFDIAAGETVGLVGESGCGKSTLSRTLLRLVNRRQGASCSTAPTSRRSREGAQALARRVQMVFQDPYARSTRGAACSTF
jgi:peptide/nickel transport system ATP-binding protein